MFISRSKQLIVMRLRDPGRVTTVIPKAKQFTHNGKDYIAVKHGPEETRVLRNIGINVPSPIKYYYSWPSRYTPFSHQKEIAAFLTGYSRAFNLSDLGTGKTLATLWAYDYLRSRKLVNKLLVISPLSTLERTWADEIFQHFPHLTTAVLHDSSDRRLKLLATDADVYLINHDGIKVRGFVEAMALRPDIDAIVVDEIAQIGRTFGTDRYKALHSICNKQHPRRVWGLTGTPTPNSPTDAWAQCRLLVPSSVPPYFNKFRDTVMSHKSQYVWVPKHDATETVHAAMQPAIRFSKDECLDLPPVLFETREAVLTATQKKAYRDMTNLLRLQVASGDITAVNEAVKAQKLIQIACGSVYDKDKNTFQLDAAPRLTVVKDIIEESKSKVIIFVPFVSVVSMVADELRKEGFHVECIHGGVGKSERDRIFGEFQGNTGQSSLVPTKHILVAQPAAMSHGLTLTAASTIIWYAPITSNEIFEQACARITRPGQKLNQLVVMIQGTEIERKYYQRLRNKQKVQGLLLEMIEDSREIA
jgi:SNF2 family DNA or RNA helicase